MSLEMQEEKRKLMGDMQSRKREMERGLGWFLRGS